MFYGPVVVKNVLLALCLAPGHLVKVVCFTLGPPLEWVIACGLALLALTVVSDRAFDLLSWALVQSWWSTVKWVRTIVSLFWTRLRRATLLEK
jgi:hypothetical protein